MKARFKVGDIIDHNFLGTGEICDILRGFQGGIGYKVKFKSDIVLAVAHDECNKHIEKKMTMPDTEKGIENIYDKDNIKAHKDIVLSLNELYAKKNADYGDSFHESYLEEGMAMPRIRLSDKLNRFKSLTKSGRQEVKDESVRDTLLDLANYAVMTVLELDREAADKMKGEK